MLNFGKSTAKEIKEYPLFTGVAGFRILTNEVGIPIINPDRATMSKYLDYVDEEGDDYNYVGSSELKKGFLLDNDELVKLSDENKIEVPYVSICFLLESVIEHEYKVKTKDGYETVKNKIRKPVTFRFYNTPNISVKTENDVIKSFKAEYYNPMGGTAWLEDKDSDPTIKSFSKEKGIKLAYKSTGSLGFSELIEFIYEYAMQPRGKNLAILDEVDFDALFKGNVESIQKIFNYIHASDNMKGDEGKPLYGIKMLFMVENNEGTGHQSRQAMYPKFQQLCSDIKGTIDDNIKNIQANITRNSKPNKNGDVKYTPAGRGWYVGKDGSAHWGIVTFKDSYMKDLKQDFDNKFAGRNNGMSRQGGNNATIPGLGTPQGGGMPMPGMQNGGSFPPPPSTPF